MPKTNPNPKFVTKGFYGTVILKDWITTLEDRSVKRITGICTLLKDEELCGFRVHGSESNWAIRVCGISQQWTILGCQIRAVVAHSDLAPHVKDGAEVVR